MRSATMAREQTISFYHDIRYLQANDHGVFMRPVFDPLLPSDGQFLRQPHGRGLTDNYYLKTIDAAPRYICLVPGEHPRLASLLEDEWKGDPNVKSVITMYFIEGTQSYTLALYFNVKEGDKTYNYYLDPQDDRDIQCQLSVKRKDVTGLDPGEMEIMNIHFLRFSNEYYNPGGDDLGVTK